MFALPGAARPFQAGLFRPDVTQYCGLNLLSCLRTGVFCMVGGNRPLDCKLSMALAAYEWRFSPNI